MIRLRLFFLFLITISVLASCGDTDVKKPNTGNKSGKGQDAMPSDLDSLKALLKNNVEDTNQVNILIAISGLLNEANSDSSLEFAKRAFDISTKLGYKTGIGKADINMGSYYIHKGKNKDAKPYFLSALKIAEEINDKRLMSVSYSHIASGEYDASNYDEAFKNYSTALEIRKTIEDSDGIATNYANLGNTNDKLGNYPQALQCHAEALKIFEQLHDDKGIATCYNNIGIIFYKQGNYPEALKNHLYALKKREKLKAKQDVGTSYQNIGNVYYSENNYEEALKNYFAALKIFQEVKYKKGESNMFNNIGNVYIIKADSCMSVGDTSSAKNIFYPKAKENFEASLNIKKEIGNKTGIANTLLDFGAIAMKQGYFDEAMKNYSEALAIFEETHGKSGIISTYDNIGLVYTEQKKTETAQKYFQLALKLATELGKKEDIRNAYRHLSVIDSMRNDYKSGLSNYKNYILYNDSLINETNTKKIVQSQMLYDFDKKTTSDSIRIVEQNKREQLKHDQEIRQQKMYTYGGVIGFLLMLVVAVVSIRAFQNKQKANETISQQKRLVDEKQKEILDSIHYAQRIQKSLLPTEKYIDRSFRRLRKN